MLSTRLPPMSTCPSCGNSDGNKVNRSSGIRRCGECDCRYGEGSGLALARTGSVFVPTICTDGHAIDGAVRALRHRAQNMAGHLLSGLVRECEERGILKSPEKVRCAFDRPWATNDTRVRIAMRSAEATDMPDWEIEIAVSIAVSVILLQSTATRNAHLGGIAKLVAVGAIGAIFGVWVG